MMKKISFFLMLLIPLSSALQFSPASLEFSLLPNEVSCKPISINADSKIIAVDDFWAESENQVWSTANFRTPASAHGLIINYPEDIDQTDTVNVCVSGSEPGEYRGALIFRQEKVGNSVVQFAIWLDVTITHQAPQTNQTNNSGGSGSSGDSGNGGSSGRGSSGSSGQTTYTTNNQVATDNAQELAFPAPSDEKITLNQPLPEDKGDTSTTSRAPMILLALIPTLIAVAALLTVLLRKRRIE